MTTRLIDESLFENQEYDGEGFDDGDPPRLSGARCSACGTVVFPRQNSCPRCSDGTMSPQVLPVSGRVWSWTLQVFPPKPPYRIAGGRPPAVPRGLCGPR